MTVLVKPPTNKQIPHKYWFDLLLRNSQFRWQKHATTRQTKSSPVNNGPLPFSFLCLASHPTNFVQLHSPSLPLCSKNIDTLFSPYFLLLLFSSPLGGYPAQQKKGRGWRVCDLHVELPHKTRKVVVLEMLGQDIPRELHDIAYNEGCSCVIPGNQVLVLFVNHHTK